LLGVNTQHYPKANGQVVNITDKYAALLTKKKNMSNHKKHFIQQLYASVENIKK